MLTRGSFGDAGELLASLENSGGTPIENELRAALEAMVRFESGTAEGRRDFEQWRRKSGAKRSASMSEYVSNFEQDGAGGPRRAGRAPTASWSAGQGSQRAAAALARSSDRRRSMRCRPSERAIGRSTA